MNPAAPSLPLAVSMGEPAGIGTEILFKAWLHFRAATPGAAPSFFTIDDPARVELLARSFGIDVPIATLADPAEAPDLFQRYLPVLPLSAEQMSGLDSVKLGAPSPETAPAVIGSIERSVDLIRQGTASGIVTLPIQKQTLAQAGFEHPGHTEFLGALAADLAMPDGFLQDPVMVLTAGTFRVVPATVHTPLRQVPETLTADHLIRTGTILAQSLARDFGVATPRIAVAGLNPHAGEDGLLGNEEKEIVAPAIAALREAGIDAIGPLPADTMFHAEARASYHAALAMYHDQALIPIKTIAFYEAVNTTIGLPIIRTSPDHGTGLNIAGRGVARPDSLINAFAQAAQMAQFRQRYDG